MDDAQKQAAKPAQTGNGTVTFTKYDRRSLSYASTFDDPWKARAEGESAHEFTALKITG